MVLPRLPAVASLAAGFDAHLTKPIDYQRLTEVLARR
jgi:hypothetical protein